MAGAGAVRVFGTRVPQYQAHFDRVTDGDGRLSICEMKMAVLASVPDCCGDKTRTVGMV